MQSAPLRLLLLASFAFWATGSAQFLHERFEHGHGDSPAQVDGHHARPATLAWTADPFGHAHEECAVCAGIASMSAARPVAAFAIGVGALCVGTSHTLGRQVTLAAFVQFPPSRGPPTALSIGFA